MAISEETKIIAYQKRQELEQRAKILLADRQTLQGQIENINAQLKLIVTEVKALKDDIPDPQP